MAKRRHHWLKLIAILSVVVLISVLYAVNKESIYTWSCETEKVGPACHVVGLINEEHKYLESAKIYFEKGCELKYELSCQKLREIKAAIKKEGVPEGTP